MCTRGRAYTRHQSTRAKNRIRRQVKNTRTREWAKEILSDARLIGFLARSPKYKSWANLYRDTHPDVRREKVLERELRHPPQPEQVYRYQPDRFEIVDDDWEWLTDETGHWWWHGAPYYKWPQPNSSLVG